MPVRIEWDDNGLSARLQGAPAGMQREMRSSFVEPLTIRAEGNVVRETPVGATGHARQGITHEVNMSGVGVEGRVYSSDVPIKTLSLEEGRSPGRMPPRAPIEMWVRRKLGASDVRSVAFLVARAIGRRGTSGAHMFQKGMSATRGQVTSQVGVLARAIGRLL